MERIPNDPNIMPEVRIQPFRMLLDIALEKLSPLPAKPLGGSEYPKHPERLHEQTQPFPVIERPDAAQLARTARQ